MNRIRTTFALLVVTALAAAAVASTASAAPRAQTDIVGTAVAAGQFTTLAKLLKAAGLVATLQKPGPYTVFAPTDAAFRKVPAKTLNALLRDKTALKAVLLYHVVVGKVAAKDVVKLTSAKTAGGESVRHQGRRRKRLRERGEGHVARRDGIQRRDPRHQPRPDPTGAVEAKRAHQPSRLLSRPSAAAGARAVAPGSTAARS